MQILVREVESYSERFMCEVVCAKPVKQIVEIGGKKQPHTILENQKTWLPHFTKQQVT